MWKLIIMLSVREGISTIKESIVAAMPLPFSAGLLYDMLQEIGIWR